MHSQTISLFRFLMLGILSKRLLVLVAIMVLTAVLSGSFINELAIINAGAVQTAFVADFLRYSLALLALLMIVTSVAEDYEFRQFERLLTMPLARWQYIAAQTLVIACLCLVIDLAGGAADFAIRQCRKSGSTGRRHYGWNCFCSEYLDYWRS